MQMKGVIIPHVNQGRYYSGKSRVLLFYMYIKGVIIQVQVHQKCYYSGTCKINFHQTGCLAYFTFFPIFTD